MRIKNKMMIGIFATLCVAYTLDAAMFEFACDKADGVYALGEKATITVKVFETNSVPLTVGKVKWRLNNFGDVTIEEGTFDLSKDSNAFTVSGALKEPGFMRLDVSEQRKLRESASVLKEVIHDVLS